MIFFCFLFYIQVALAAFNLFHSNTYHIQREHFNFRFNQLLSKPLDHSSEIFVNNYSKFLRSHWKNSKAIEIKWRFELEKQKALDFLSEELIRLPELAEEWIISTSTEIETKFDAWLQNKFRSSKYIKDPVVRSHLKDIETEARRKIFLESQNSKWTFLLSPLKEIIASSHYLGLIRGLIRDMNLAYEDPWSKEADKGLDSYTIFLDMNKKKDAIVSVMDEYENHQFQVFLQEISEKEYDWIRSNAIELMNQRNHDEVATLRSLFFEAKKAFDVPLLSLSLEKVEKIVSFASSVNSCSHKCQSYLKRFKKIKLNALDKEIKSLDPLLGSHMTVSHYNVDQQIRECEKVMSVILDKVAAFNDPLSSESLHKIQEYMKIASKYNIDVQEIKNQFDKSVETRILSFLSNEDPVVSGIIHSQNIKDLNTLQDLYKLVIAKRYAFHNSDLLDSQQKVQDYADMLTSYGLNKESEDLLKDFEEEKIVKCIICFQSLDTDLQTLSCKHQFHKDCIKKYLLYL